MQKVETKRSTVYLVNESELSGLKKIGRQMRAQCPVHHSRDRDLVLVPFKSDGYLSKDEEKNAGLGYCHSDKCRAIVRVIEWNPDAASRLLGRKVKAGEPRYWITDKDQEEADERQQRELTALNKVHETAASALHHSRCLGYLSQRGLGSEEALALLERLGVGYIPPSEDWKKKPPFELLKWCDRIIFPFTTRDGERGYVGRTLMLWTPGMDENEHKRRLHEHDERMEEQYGVDTGKHQIQRWRKTYRAGFFNASVLGEHRHIVLTEGTFDAIPLMLVGLENVVAIAGTALDIEWMRNEKKVMEVTLAFDADTDGKQATARTIDRINGTGITARACTPPDDGKGKDWSERYRLAGIDGLAPVLSIFSSESESNENMTGNPDHGEATLRVVTPCVVEQDSNATSNHESTEGIPETALSPDAVPESLDQDEKGRKRTNELAPNAPTVGLVAGDHAEKLEKTRKNSNEFGFHTVNDELITNEIAQKPDKTGKNRKFDLDQDAPLPDPDQDYQKYLQAPQSIDQAYERYTKAVDLLALLDANGLALVYGVDGHPVWTEALEPYRELLTDLKIELQDILNVPQEVKPLTSDDPVVSEICSLFGATVIEILPRHAWTEEYKQTLLQQTRASMVKPFKRGAIKQRLLDQWIEQGDDFTGLDGQWGAYYDMPVNEAYRKAFKETEQALLNLEIPPRVYPCPFPDYGYKPDGSFGVVGMHGCNPGEYWTLAEWKVIQGQEAS